MGAILLVVAILLPTAIGVALLATGRAIRWFAERRYQAAAAAEPIERLGADLRRLHAQLEALENQPACPGKGLRVRAMRAAYVDALRTACARLHVNGPLPAHADVVPRTEIYRVEADLRRCGLDVRTTVPG